MAIGAFFTAPRMALTDPQDAPLGKEPTGLAF